MLKGTLTTNLKLQKLCPQTGLQCLYTVVEYNVIVPFHLKCCGPNGPSINTLVTCSLWVLSINYLNNYPLSRMCQFLALHPSFASYPYFSSSLEVILCLVIILGRPCFCTRCPIGLVSQLPSSYRISLIPSSS